MEAVAELVAEEAVSTQFVTFTNDDRHYGIEIMRVREIRQWSPTTELPNQPFYTRGVINIRGSIVPVHDLRARFGGSLTEASENHAILIVSQGGQDVGVLVDAVSDIVSVSADERRSVPSGAREVEDGSVTSLICRDEKMIALLDPERLFPTVEVADI